jgi:ribosomal protein S18 acetylase RimI-like enzyme
MNGQRETRHAGMPRRIRRLASETIDHATRSDLPRLREIWLASQGGNSTGESTPWTRMHVAARLKQRHSLHCLRDAEGRACAFLGVTGPQIDVLCVHPGHRGRGLGRALMQFAARVLRADRAEIETCAVQATHFLHHLGFRTVERLPRDSQGNPSALLRLSLDPFAPRRGEAATA